MQQQFTHPVLDGIKRALQKHKTVVPDVNNVSAGIPQPQQNRFAMPQSGPTDMHPFLRPQQPHPQPIQREAQPQTSVPATTEMGWGDVISKSLQSGATQASANIMNLPRLAHRGAAHLSDALLPENLYDIDKDPLARASDRMMQDYDETILRQNEELANLTGIKEFVSLGLRPIPQVILSAVAALGIMKAAPAVAAGGLLTAGKGTFMKAYPNIARMIPFGLLAGSGAAREAERDGASYTEQVLAGVLIGAGEMAAESIPFGYALRAIDNIGVDNLVEHGAKNLLRQYGTAGINFLKAGVTEAMEEAVMAPWGRYVQKSVYNPDIPLSGPGGIFDTEIIVQAGLGGVAMSVILGALGLPATTASYVRAHRAIRDGERMTEVIADLEKTMPTDLAAYDQQLAETLPPLQGGTLADVPVAPPVVGADEVAAGIGDIPQAPVVDVPPVLQTPAMATTPTPAPARPHPPIGGGIRDSVRVGDKVRVNFRDEVLEVVDAADRGTVTLELPNGTQLKAGRGTLTEVVAGDQPSPLPHREAGTAIPAPIAPNERDNIPLPQNERVGVPGDMHPRTPITLFHGSRNEVKGELKPGRAQAGEGIFLTDNEDSAREYGANVYRVEISPQKVATDEDWRRAYNELEEIYHQRLSAALDADDETLIEQLEREWTRGEMADPQQNALVSRRLKEQGFDVLVTDMQSGDRGDEYLVLNPAIITAFDGRKAPQAATTATEKVGKTAPEAEPTEQPKAADIGRLTVEKTTHTKTGQDIWVVRMTDRLDRDAFKKVQQKVTQLGGSRHSTFTKGFNFFKDPTDILAQIVAVMPETTPAAPESPARDAKKDKNVTLRRLWDEAEGASYARKRANFMAAKAKVPDISVEEAQEWLKANVDIKTFAEKEPQAETLISLRAELKERILNDRFIKQALISPDKPHVDDLRLALQRVAKKEQAAMMVASANNDTLDGDLWNVFNTDDERTRIVDQIVSERKKIVEQQEDAETIKGKDVVADTPSLHVAEFVVGVLKAGGRVDAASLQAQAEKAWGATLAEGVFDRKDIYDAMELGVNLYLASKEGRASVGPMTDSVFAKNVLSRLEKLLSALPTQTVRSKEQDDFQQFSTPPNLAYVAAWVASPTRNDVVLEPSAGIGGLAVFAKTAGAEVIVNEFSPRRAAVLQHMGFDRLFNEDATQLDNILPDDVRPTLIIMNPPFTSAGDRNVKGLDVGTRHIEQALKRLEPGGRLVAIVGRGLAEERPTAKQWWNKIKKEYNVKANIGIDGQNYKKYGTTFDVRLLVIDKDGPTTGKTSVGEYKSLNDVIDTLEVLKNARKLPEVRHGQDKPAAGKQAGQRPAQEGQAGNRPTGGTPSATRPAGGTGQRDTAAGADVVAGTDRILDGDRPKEGDGLPDKARLGDRGQVGGDGTAGGVQKPSPARGAVSGTGDSAPDRVRTAEHSYRRSITTSAKEGQKTKELTDAIYDEYQPQILFEGAKPHPSILAESAAMASVSLPPLSVTLNIPQEVIVSGAISSAQLEPIAYAKQAWQEILPDGTRKGFFVGDGTGGGKGRIIAGAILDSFHDGQTKAVWITKNAKLLADSVEFWEALGGKSSDIVELKKINDNFKKGILFAPYMTIAKGSSVTIGGQFTAGEKSRLKQIEKWLGKDFDGVIAFDEAHLMKNFIGEKPAVMAVAGVHLQKMFPKARILYASATAATEVKNLAYATRLGLWGEGTAFASVEDFISKIDAGGMAAMEVIARDMKALGVYLARTLSYDGVEYDRLVHNLTPEQQEVYNNISDGWQVILKNIDEALKLTKSDKTSKKAYAYQQFWNTQLRYYNNLLTSLQMPSVISAIKADLDKGHAIVLQLVNTNAAALDRALASLEDDETLDDIDLTPKDTILQMIESAFPTQEYQEVVEYVAGAKQKSYRPVVDKEGNPVHNKEALRKKEELIKRIAVIKMPDGPLDMIINEFGPDNVAEVTGRSKRIVYRHSDTSGELEKQVETISEKAMSADVNAFMDDKKRILVFSNAGGTGKSYHADRTRKNQRQRVHYLIQAGFQAEAAVQGLGRTHRSNEASKPIYRLVTTDLKGNMRFISTIARRLDQLGALTKGQRQAGSQGLFSEKDNLEGPMARDTLYQFFGRLAQTNKGHELLKKMGLYNMLIDSTSGTLKHTPAAFEVTRFLNRILVLNMAEQNAVFEEYSTLLDSNIEEAIKNDRLDIGLETLRADSLKVMDKRVVYTEPKTGAETIYYELEEGNKTHPMSFEAAHFREKKVYYYRNTRSGRIYVATDGGTRTDANTGRIKNRLHLQGRHKASFQRLDEDALSKDTWEVLTKVEAEKAWEKELATLPKMHYNTTHMISGALLPIWGRLPSGRMRVVRAQTNDGEIILGRVIGARAIDSTLRNLGAEKEVGDMSSDKVMQMVLDGHTAHLANGWRIVRRMVSRQSRIEIVGIDVHKFFEQFKPVGVFEERINWDYRYFIPTNNPGAMAKVLDNRPITHMEAPAKKDAEEQAFSVNSEILNRANKALADRIRVEEFSFESVHRPEKTSIRQVAKGLVQGVKENILSPRRLNIDIGGGRFDEGAEYLKNVGIRSLVYDPYARTEEHNASVMNEIKNNGGADTATLNNVLNVIPTAKERADVLALLYEILKPGGNAIITVYDGDRTGKGRRRNFSDGTSTWQENRLLADYEQEIKGALPDATIIKRAGMFILKKEDAEEQAFMSIPAAQGRTTGAAQPGQPQAGTTQTAAQKREHFQAKAKERQADITKEHILRTIRSHFNVVIRLNRFRGKSKAAIYKPRSEIIRAKSKYARSLRHVTHELGHHLDKLYGLTDARFEDELLSFPYVQDLIAAKPKTPEKVAMKEGVAEFIHMYLMDPAGAETIAPAFMERFEDNLTSMPDVQDKLLDIRAMIDVYTNKSDVEAHLDEFIGGEGPKHDKVSPAVLLEKTYGWWDSFLSAKDKLTTMIVDRHNPIWVAAEIITGDPNNPHYQGVRDMIRTSVSMGSAEQLIKEGQYVEELDDRGRPTGFVKKVGPGLMEIWTTIGALGKSRDEGFDIIALFDTYIVAKHAIESEEQGIVSGALDADKGITIEHLEAFVRKIETGEYAKPFKRQLEEVIAYRNFVFEKLVAKDEDSPGHYSEADKEQILGKWQYPIPFKRIFPEDRAKGRGGGHASPVKRYKGADLPIVRPIESLLRETMLYTRLAQENEAAVTFFNLSKKFPSEAGQLWDDTIPLPQTVTKTSLQDVLSQAISKGLDPGFNVQELGNLSIELYKGIHTTQAGKNIAIFWIGGKPKAFEIYDKELFGAITGLNTEQSVLAARIASKLSVPFRLGHIVNLVFPWRNTHRDAPAAAAHSEHGYIPYVSFFDGLLSLIAGPAEKAFAKFTKQYDVSEDNFVANFLQQQDEYKQAWLFYGGTMQSPDIYTDNAAERMLQQVMQKEIKQSVAYWLHPMSTLRGVATASEMGSVIGETKRAYAKGATGRRAIAAGRDLLVDHNVYGSKMMTMRQVIPFLGAFIQGSAKMYRQVKNPRTRWATLMKYALFITIPTIINYLRVRENPHYKEMNPLLRDAAIHIPIGDPKTTKLFLPIPRAHSLPGWVFGAMVERALAFVDNTDKDAFHNWQRTFTRNFVPPLTVWPAELTYELMANYNVFRGVPIENMADLNLPKEERYGPLTSETAKAIGRLTGRSPKKIDFAIGKVTGALGRPVIALTDALLDRANLTDGIIKAERTIDTKPIIGDYFRSFRASSSISIALFYEDLEKATKIYNSERGPTNQSEQAYVEALPELRRVQRELSEMRRAERAVHKARTWGDVADYINPAGRTNETITAAEKRRLIEFLQMEQINVVRRAYGKELLRH